jgi:hypothetical protein
MKPHMHLVEISTFSLNLGISDLPKLLRTSVKPVHKYYLCTGFADVLNNFKPVHKYYLCTGFADVLNNFGRSGDDMI